MNSRIIVAYDRASKNIDSGVTMSLAHKGNLHVLFHIIGEQADLFYEAWNNLNPPVAQNSEFTELALRALHLLGETAQLPLDQRNGLVDIVNKAIKSNII